jgi:hypothetical protein
VHGECDPGAFEAELSGRRCLPGGTRLCLHDNRFEVTAQFRTASRPPALGHAVQLSPDSGLFWFFGPDNMELSVKVLDACSLNRRFWFFAAGTTNVEVVLVVDDLLAHTAKVYTNALGTPFAPILDTGTLATCQ